MALKNYLETGPKKNDSVLQEHYLFAMATSAITSVGNGLPWQL